MIRHITEAPIQRPMIDGEHDAVVYRIVDTGAADSDYVIGHELGRVPICCRILLSNKSVNMWVKSKDNYKVVVQFTTANCDVNVEVY